MEKMRNAKKRKGFTLIELIVVIAIIGILAVIAIPRLSGFQDSAKMKADIATGKTLATATATLIADQKITHTAAKTLTVSSSSTNADVVLIRGYLQNVPKNKYGVAEYTVTISTSGDVQVISNTAAGTAGTYAADGLYPVAGTNYSN